jgi:hypothetical protein
MQMLCQNAVFLWMFTKSSYKYRYFFVNSLVINSDRRILSLEFNEGEGVEL